MQPKKLFIFLADGVGLRNFAFTQFYALGKESGYDFFLHFRLPKQSYIRLALNIFTTPNCLSIWVSQWFFIMPHIKNNLEIFNSKIIHYDYRK
jgi:hypothetical protein